MAGGAQCRDVRDAAQIPRNKAVTVKGMSSGLAALSGDIAFLPCESPSALWKPLWLSDHMMTVDFLPGWYVPPRLKRPGLSFPCSQGHANHAESAVGRGAPGGYLGPRWLSGQDQVMCPHVQRRPEGSPCLGSWGWGCKTCRYHAGVIAIMKTSEARSQGPGPCAAWGQTRAIWLT